MFLEQQEIIISIYLYKKIYEGVPKETFRIIKLEIQTIRSIIILKVAGIELT